MFSDNQADSSLNQNSNMHNSYIIHIIQHGPSTSRGVQVWRYSILGYILLLAARGRAANNATAACDGAAQPARSCWCLESCSYTTRFDMQHFSSVFCFGSYYHPYFYRCRSLEDSNLIYLLYIQYDIYCFISRLHDLDSKGHVSTERLYKTTFNSGMLNMEIQFS